jgi:hypothetical protein
MKDLLINNGLGAGAFVGVHLADTVSPSPSSFWQAFALLALNSSLTFGWRWYREMKRKRSQEQHISEQLEALTTKVDRLRTDFDDSQKPRSRGGRRRLVN